METSEVVNIVIIYICTYYVVCYEIWYQYQLPVFYALEALLDPKGFPRFEFFSYSQILCFSLN